MTKSPYRRATVVAFACLVALAGCTGAPPDPPPPSGGVSCAPAAPVALTVLAGSELSDVEPLLGELAACTGITLTLEKVGTLEGADRLAKGEAFDLAWFSTASYLNLLTQPGGPGRPIATESIMYSPVVLGVKTSVADRFGWTATAEVTWADVAAKADAGEFRYAMTDPTKSNSGFAAMLGAATEFAGTGAALRLEDIDEPALAGFLAGHALPASSSEWLKDAYLADQDRLEGMVNYESVLLHLNADTRLTDKHRLIYPKDGIIMADYPLMMMNASRRQEYRTVVQWLLSPPVQERLMRDTARRPANTTVTPDSRFPTTVLTALPLPATFDVFTRLFDIYHRYRIPPHTVYLLDLSGSMEGKPLADLKSVLFGLAGTDTSLTGRLSQFRPGERVTLITFSDRIMDERDFVINNPAPDSPDLAALRAYVDGLSADGWTAIYSSTLHAYQKVAATAGDGQALTTVVLLTDGENNRGISGQQFLDAHRDLAEPARRVRTFAIQFGDANPAELRLITDATGGGLFDATTTSLRAAFTEIRGYQ